MEARRYPTFGQELYLRETLKAAATLVDTGLRRGVSEIIAASLDHPSPKTRARIAAKLVQRLRSGAAVAEDRPHFLRLLTGIGDMSVRRDLVYYATARADPLVGAVAAEVLYPVLIESATPGGTLRDEMAPHRAGLLLTVEPIVPVDFLLRYAGRVWRYGSRRSLLLALRILRQVGIARTVRMQGASGTVEAIALSPHDLSPAAFLWCFMDEFGRSVPPATADRVERSRFARVFVVPPSLIDVRLDQAERGGFLRMRNMAGARRVIPALTAGEAVERLLQL